MQLQQAHFFVENYAFDFAPVDEDQSHEQNCKSDYVLPPVAFSVALENRPVLAQSQMVDEIQGANDDKTASDPERAREFPKHDLVLALLFDVDVRRCGDQDPCIEIVLGAALVLDDGASLVGFIIELLVTASIIARFGRCAASVTHL